MFVIIASDSWKHSILKNESIENIDNRQKSIYSSEGIKLKQRRSKEPLEIILHYELWIIGIDSNRSIQFHWLWRRLGIEDYSTIIIIHLNWYKWKLFGWIYSTIVAGNIDLILNTWMIRISKLTVIESIEWIWVKWLIWIFHHSNPFDWLNAHLAEYATICQVHSVISEWNGRI